MLARVGGCSEYPQGLSQEFFQTEECKNATCFSEGPNCKCEITDLKQ